MSTQSIFQKTSLSLLVVILLLLVSSVLQLSAKSLSKDITALQNEHLEFVHISNIVQKISDDLTHLSKMFVLTGEDKYRKIYDEIVDIRDGNREIPKLYHGYMTRKVTNLSYEPEMDDSINIQQYFNKLSSENPELSYIFNAKNESKILSEMEIEAMKSVQGIGKDTAFLELQSEDYLYAKSKIIKKREVAIKHIKERIDEQKYRINSLINILTFFNELTILSLIVFMLISTKKIKNLIFLYINKLCDWGEELAKGHYDKEVLIDLPSEFKNLKLVMSDIAANAKENLLDAKLESKIDVLTGLPNKRSVVEFFIEKQNEIERYGSTYSIIIINVRNLELYNKEYGYEFTNNMIVEFSKLVKENIRASDYFACVGFGLYIISQPYATNESAKNMMEKISSIIETTTFEFSKQKSKLDATFSYDLTQTNIHDTFNSVVDNCLKLK